VACAFLLKKETESFYGYWALTQRRAPLVEPCSMISTFVALGTALSEKKERNVLNPDRANLLWQDLSR
jgi:hypothetical protein